VNLLSTVLGAAAAASVAAAACAGCSSSSKPAAAPPTTAAPATTAPATTGPATTAPASPSSPPTSSARAALSSIGSAAANSDTVSLAKGAQGIFLIAPDGHSLYVFDNDHGSTSGCTGACASLWPALTDTGSISTGAVVNKAEVTTATGQAADQVTYYGHLLYEFRGDRAPGQTNGTSIPGWHLLGPFGNVMLPRA
jgi:predicted lipoprotein with Yx(FWY)xxD motif